MIEVRPLFVTADKSGGILYSFEETILLCKIGKFCCHRWSSVSGSDHWTSASIKAALKAKR